MTTAIHPLQAFQWTPQPQAEAIVREMVDIFLAHSPAGSELAQRMRELTGTRFIDWIDHIAWPLVPALAQRVEQAGFVPQAEWEGCYVHPGGLFPRLLLTADSPMAVAIKVESVADLLAAHGMSAVDWPIEGAPLAPCRWACIAVNGNAELWAIERHGYAGFDVPGISAGETQRVLRHAEAFRLRKREFASPAEGFAHAMTLIDEAIEELSVDRACDLFFAAEREYWQGRNRAAQVQRSRQGRLGLGWANHDHHTYRSSREHFTRLIAAFEKLGFQCRERFYAGQEAGWGAQVLEQPTAGVVIFADVDLAPEELYNDFAHEPLPPRSQLGTVGLWCGLHGEAFLEAGMHHLECQFDFESLREQLDEEAGIQTMKPFTDLPYLRQAFTEGERWPVREDRIADLLAREQISEAQARQFRESGAIGSHLENLERNAGFKGFNQKGVNEIIEATDPRKHTPIAST